MENDIVKRLEEILKDLAPYQKKGLDTSSLKIFMKGFKDYLKFSVEPYDQIEVTLDEKLIIIRTFLEDKKAFPTIKDVISFANERLNLGFKDQKESRDITINRIIGRIAAKPELKELLKNAVISLRNEMVHDTKNTKSRKQIITIDTFSKWAEIIKNI
ncbi:hypothetical protein EYY60_15775 [Flavobacterium zhairuonense]|uniref:hypothetical protein n=1 Tax=Flavobacterium zhairuonense TaxID=2493631 RepID=UPI0010482A61|nr:hypothetical protein [Flavobacterium zhairuonense]KAF2508585.1 hypothetical protein EYY60_15775 [Flavobacterium zhairuonense]